MNAAVRTFVELVLYYLHAHDIFALVAMYLHVHILQCNAGLHFVEI